VDSHTVNVTMDFICDRKAVWEALVTPELYDLWYAKRDGDGGVEDKQLSLGSKIKFDDREQTSVVTDFYPISKITIATGKMCDEFVINKTEFGCSLTLNVSDYRLEEKEQLALAEKQLTKLKEAVYKRIENTSKNMKQQIIPRIRTRRLRTFLSGLLQGYKPPITPRKTAMAESEVVSSIIDNSQTDVIIHLRAGLAALMCAVILFSALAFTSRIQEYDFVPSSGMSLTESIHVNKENASGIYIGQYQSSVERVLNCKGSRLSNTDFYYLSTKRGPGGDTLMQLIVSYDAYKHVRRVTFLDNTTANKPLDVPVSDVNALLTPGMTPLEVEEQVGWPLSAFTLDKSGLTTVYFGVVERFDFMNTAESTYEIFVPGIMSQLVAVLDTTSESTETQYFKAYKPDNPLPLELTDQTKKQYSNSLDNYRSDRFAYERMFLLLPLPDRVNRRDADIILNSTSEHFLPIAGGDIVCTYILRSRVAEETGHRYIYEVTFGEDDIIKEVSMLNRYLEQKTGVMQNREEYDLEQGMSLYEVYSRLGILPTYAVLNERGFTLCYGSRIGETTNIRLNYELYLAFDDDNILTEMRFN